MIKALTNFREESGGALVLVAISMVALLGFTAIVIDAGRLFITKSQLQNALDAGVLGGAQGLLVSTAHAESIAIEIADKNGYVLENSEVKAETKQYIEAKKTVTVPMTFAKIINIPTASVTAKAKAIVAPLKKARGIAPIAISKDLIPEGPDGTNLLCTKEILTDEEKQNQPNSGQHSPGNCGFLSLTGAEGEQINLKEALLNGGTYSTDDEPLTTKPGGITQAKGPIDELIKMDESAGRTHCEDYTTADNSCKRVIYVVVIDSWDGINGTKQVDVVGFAAYWIEGYDFTGQDKYLKGRIIDTISPGEIEEMIGEWDDNLLYGVTLSE
nr:Tad domain-containing protein [Mesobacillus harenae]